MNAAVLRDSEEKGPPDELENVCSVNNDGNGPLAHPSFSSAQTRTGSTGLHLLTSPLIVVMVFGFVCQ